MYTTYCCTESGVFLIFLPYQTIRILILSVFFPLSGDAFEAGDEVRVAWESSLDSSLFDISLLNDGVNVSLDRSESATTGVVVALRVAGCFATLA